MNIHPTAVISPEAIIHSGAQIGPYCVIERNVSIGKDTLLTSHVVVGEGTIIGEGCRIAPFVSLGGLPQDLKFGGEKTRVIIGNFNDIREFVTINRATKADAGMTLIGEHNLIMAYCHIAHNCQLGNHIVMANASHLAGHVIVEDYAVIGGLVGVHQFSRIGAHAMVGGASAVNRDVPPYCTVFGNHARLFGLNLIGLKRRGFSDESIKALKTAYRYVFRSGLLLSEAIEKVRREVINIPEVEHFLEFIISSKRGVCR